MKKIEKPGEHMPECDLCHARREPIIYNTPVKGYGCWGNLCEDCMEVSGIMTSVTEMYVRI